MAKANTKVVAKEKDKATKMALQIQNRFQELVTNGEISLAPGYSVVNAVKSAFLKLQEMEVNGKSVVDVCTQASIAQSLLSMVIQGLTTEKDQGYFIAYKNKLHFQRGYFGTIAVLERVCPVEDIYSQVVYKDDKLEYELVRGNLKITKHMQQLENVGTEIVAAYATLTFTDGRPDYTELMTAAEIEAAWKMGSGYKEKGSGVHQKFPQEMSKKTVINRAAKRYINRSSDDSLLIETFKQSEIEGAETRRDIEIEEHANTEPLNPAYAPLTFKDSRPEEDGAPIAEPEWVDEDGVIHDEDPRREEPDEPTEAPF